MSEGGAAGAACGGVLLAPPSAAFWACRSLHVGLLPARLSRGGPDVTSEESTRAGAVVGAEGAVGRSGIRSAPLFLAAARLATASSSRWRWRAACSSTALVDY